VFEYTAEANRLMMCKQCFPFSYANAEHTGCECSGGYYAENSEVQPVRCKRCPQGTYKAEAGNGGIAACIACPEGLEPSGSGKSCGKWPSVDKNKSGLAWRMQQCLTQAAKRAGLSLMCAQRVMVATQRRVAVRIRMRLFTSVQQHAWRSLEMCPLLLQM
jgi:hypothetical protein